MMKRFMILAAAGASIAALSATASQAQTAVTSTTDLNVRAGPGVNFPIVGVLPVDDAGTLEGCTEAGDWCEVTVNGTTGWASSQYLTTDVGGETVVVVQRRQAVPDAFPVVTYQDTAPPLGVEPVGELVVSTDPVPVAPVTPPAPGLEYVRTNPLDPVYLQGETVVGASIPQTVQLTPVPEYQLEYANINGQQVLVDPTTRQIRYIVR